MTEGPTVADLRSAFASPPPDSRPMMRWWWFGPDVERTELDRELRAMAAAGIGGVEVSYVYPMRAGSPELLSPPMLDNLRYAAEHARDLGLRFDLTLGSGWSFGGPHITTDVAAQKLEFERREISPGSIDLQVTQPWPGDLLVAAYLGSGSIQEPPTDLRPVDIVDGTLSIPAGSGPRQLLLAYVRSTGQVVKRAAAGADGPVLDHYSAAAARTHLEHVAAPLLDAVGAELVGSVFCDSLEVYTANWTPELLAEFERRCGYPLLPRLYQLVVDQPGSDQLRSDYYRTLTELYEENFVAVFRDWAAGRGVPFRIQGYGTPPARVSSYRFADLYEGEGWGWKEITQTRWASSAAHLDGLPVVSSETWTWVHSPSFRATPLDLLGEAHEHLLAGINQFIGHGWPYSPADPPQDGLGWYFYAAGALDDRNPWWPAMPGLMAQLQRLCWLMRQGAPRADVLLYVPAEDVYPRLGHEAGGSLDLWRETVRSVDPAIPATIRENGYDFDLLDDPATERLDPGRSPVVVLPGARRIPAPTRAWLERVIATGGRVLWVGDAAVWRDGAEGEPTPDFDRVAVGGLADALRSVLEPDLAVSPQQGDVGSVHRRIGDLDVHLVVNAGPHARVVACRPRDRHDTVEVWDPADGRLTFAGSADRPVDLQLEPYQAAVIVGHDGPRPDLGQAPVPPVERDVRTLDGDWTVTFDGAEPQQVQLPHRWEDAPERVAWSGTAEYRTTVEIDRSTLESGRLWLDLGPTRPREPGAAERDGMRGNSYRVAVSTPVGEVVEVIANDRPCGVLWKPPYRLDVGIALHPGRNELRLRVSNTAANALSADTAIGRIVAESREHYGRRFQMQDLDRALDGVDSGLLTVPVLRRVG